MGWNPTRRNGIKFLREKFVHETVMPKLPSAPIGFASVAVFVTGVMAMDRDELKNVPSEIRQWFERMQSPDGTPCCSYADGHRTEYRTEGDQYLVPISGKWYPVPPEAVIHGQQNPIGEAVVWYKPEIVARKWNGQWKIVCFVPAAGA
jgi:hypothetical protein